LPVPTGDYSTPIRNVEVALMNGPAIEVAALDSHVALQLQAEAQQKQCDYILYWSVSVKHSSGGTFGKFMKLGSTVSSLTPLGMMTKSVGTMVAAQAAGAAASQMAARQMQAAGHQPTCRVQWADQDERCRDCPIPAGCGRPDNPSPAEQSARESEVGRRGRSHATARTNGELGPDAGQPT